MHPHHEKTFNFTPIRSVSVKQRQTRYSRTMERKTKLNIAVSLLIFLAILFSGIQLSKNIPGGVYDEVAHADMVYQTYTNGFTPVSGSTIADWTVKQAGCRGFIAARPSLEECGIGPYDVNDLAKDGLNTASGYPPVYYLVTAYVARALDAIDGDEQISWMRIRNINIALYALGISASFALFRFIGATTLQSSMGAIWLASIPIAMYQGSTINPEGVSFLAASLFTILALRSNFSTRSALLIGLMSAVLLLVKPTFLFAAVAGLTIYALRFYKHEKYYLSEIVKTRGASFIALLAGILVPLVSWTIYSSQTSTLDNSSTYGNTTFGQLASEIPFWNRYLIGINQYVDIARDLTTRGLIDNSIGYRLAVVTSLLVVVYVFMKGFLGFSKTVSSEVEFISVAVFISIAITAALLIIAAEQLTNIFFVSGRYALPILPIALAAFMIELRNVSTPARYILAALVVAQTTWLVPYFT
jgi:hypothetical protein